MNPKNEYRYYSSNEILEVLREQHRLCSPLDPMADESFPLTRETTISDWQEAQDLLGWSKLAEFINQKYRIDVPQSEWKKVLIPEHKRTLGNLCDFLSTKARKELIKPVTRLGAECLTAAIFLTLKRNLKNKGADVLDLKPSTRVDLFLEKDENFSPLIEEATLTGIRIFDKLEYGPLTTHRRCKHWIDRIIPKWMYKRPINTGNIQTFRDLVERIVADKNPGTAAAWQKQG